MTTKFIIKTPDGTIELDTAHGWNIALHMLKLMSGTRVKKLNPHESDYADDFIERQISYSAQILIEQIEFIITVGLRYDTAEFDSDIEIKT